MPSSAPFKAFLINQERDGVVGGFASMTEAELDPGEVTIRVAYSSVNYKDALAATGAGRIIRRFPCVGGIDLSGSVISSTDPRFSPGDEVLATSYDIGVAHHGGYAEVARIPAKWVLKLPAVQTVALELGYENASGFITMFRKAVGKPPARYLFERTEKATGGASGIMPGKIYLD